jgi:NAD(P)-dependent dehydrogenase (short-subunit alcohol dehydrogenase family)
VTVALVTDGGTGIGRTTALKLARAREHRGLRAGGQPLEAVRPELEATRVA